jgi:hypothetical protein
MGVETGDGDRRQRSAQKVAARHRHVPRGLIRSRFIHLGVLRWRPGGRHGFLPGPRDREE